MMVVAESMAHLKKKKKVDGSRTKGNKKYYRNVVATRQKEPGNPEGSNNRERKTDGKDVIMTSKSCL